MIYKKLFPVLFFIICVVNGSNSQAQIEEDVLSHFIENNFQNEYLTYIRSLEMSEDSSHYFLAKYHLHYENWSEFKANYDLSENVVKHDSLLLEMATTKILGIDESIRQTWFDSVVLKYPFLVKYDTLYRFANHKRKVNIEVPLAISESMKKYKKANKKSPFLAATLSTLVPGLGKIYVGNYRTGLFSLFTMSVFGLQTYESYDVKGPEHVLTITNAGFFSGYYISNIAGSYRDAKQKKLEFRNQFLIDASTYYFSRIRGSLF